MNPSQTSDNIEENNVSFLRNDMQNHKSEQFEKEPSPVNLPYKPEAVELFDI
ncbi:13711_t:CDS:1, partial [Cetraspora pellucida]